jgi:hypothetical protein
MRFPPSHTAFIRAKATFLRSLRMLERFAAVITAIVRLCWQSGGMPDSEVVSAAVRFHSICGNTKFGGDGGVTLAFTA